MLPTTPPGLTAQGTILGTFQYMAPEQLEGREADARTDIFAFGAVIYEMLTGNKAFGGNSHASLIAAILERNPAPVSSLQPLAPSALDRAVTKCLRKDPDERWQTSRDLFDELRWIADKRSATGGESAAVSAGATRRSRTFRVAALAAVAWIAIAMGIGSGYFVARTRTKERPAHFSIVPPAGVTIPVGGVVSPDGTRIVFQGVEAGGAGRLYLRDLDDPSLTPIAGTEGAYLTGPAWRSRGRRTTSGSCSSTPKR